MTAVMVAPGWRKTSPTIDEVRACRWWWHRAPGMEPHTFMLKVDAIGIFIPGAAARPSGLPRASEWAPCLPPSDDCAP